jgi:hypothetical protein
MVSAKKILNKEPSSQKKKGAGTRDSSEPTPGKDNPEKKLNYRSTG